MVLAGVLLEQFAGERYIRWAGWLLLAGTVLFSGSLYLLALSGVRTFGAITPLGGVTLLGGWAALVITSYSIHYTKLYDIPLRFFSSEELNGVPAPSPPSAYRNNFV